MPTEGKYANLSEAITSLKPTIFIVGKQATRKTSHPINNARVHRSEINKPGISRHVPTTPANTA